MKLFMGLILAVFSQSALANVSDTLCDVDGQNVSFDLGSSTPPVSGSRGFYALEISKKGHQDAKGSHQILATDAAYRFAFQENNGDFNLRITSRKSHKLVFSAQKKTGADGVVKTDTSSSMSGFKYSTTTFSCH